MDRLRAKPSFTFRRPWGLNLELISYPEGMAYAAGAEILLWDPRV